MIKLARLALHVGLYRKPGSVLLRLKCVINVISKATIQSCVILKVHLPQARRLPIGTQGTSEVEAVEAMDADELCMKLRPAILQNP